MKPAIQLKTHKDPKLSRSFLGGLPQVPSGFEWPVWDATPYYRDEIEYAEKNLRQFNSDYWAKELSSLREASANPVIPLTFLGQVDLEDVPRFGDFPDLPKTGILYFFWDILLCPPGFQASSKGSCRVIYLEKFSNLNPLSFPEDLHKRSIDILDLPLNDVKCSLSFHPAWTSSNYLENIFSVDTYDGIAEFEPFLKEKLEFIPENFPARNSSSVLIEDDTQRKEAIHYLMGSPMVIQNPMEEMCQLCFHGFDAIKYDINSNPEVAHLKDGVDDWKLLLQLDSDENLGWEWGDVGMLYFWIRKQDLQKQDFSNVWCEMQCS